MARKTDSGWRDHELSTWMLYHDYPTNVPGMRDLFVEYDFGSPVGFVHYVRRGADALADQRGKHVGDAFRAVAGLTDGASFEIPFITCVYDPRNWSVRLFGHNDAGRSLLDRTGWVSRTEKGFARILYRMRGRDLPDLSRHGVTFNDEPWMLDDQTGLMFVRRSQDISARRRLYQPEQSRGVRAEFLTPCADIDHGIIKADGSCVGLFVDYKREEARFSLGHPTHRAMTGLRNRDGSPVASMVTRYEFIGGRPRFYAHPLNGEAVELLTRVLVSTNAVSVRWTPDEWTCLDERRWLHVLAEAAG